MKKTIILSGFAVLLAFAASAQADEATIKKDEQVLAKQERHIRHEKKEERKELRKERGKDVDIMAKDQFKIDFGDVTAESWRRDPAFDVVSFTKDGVSKTAYYDFNDKLVGTTENKTFADLPPKGREYLMNKYSGFTIGDIMLFDDNETNETDMILYGHPFEDADNYFVELTKGAKKIILRVDMEGAVSYFTQVR